MPLLDDYMTRAELAVQLNCTERTLERWFSQGTGPAITRLGKTPIYRIASVQAWLLNQERQFVCQRGRQTGRKRLLKGR